MSNFEYFLNDYHMRYVFELLLLAASFLVRFHLLKRRYFYLKFQIFYFFYDLFI